jgi:uncharacterized protein (TIGR00369 family)
LTSDAAVEQAIAGRGGAVSPASSFEFEPHNCFACGSLNDGGLQLQLHLERERSWAEVTLDDRFEGWVGIAHGGIIATILDEVMAWAIVAEENWGVTARMTIDYKRPVRVGTRIRAEGWIVRSRRRLVETAGRIVDGAGTLLATAEAVYVAADEARRRELQERYGYRIRASRETAQAATPASVDAAGESASPRAGRR